MGRVQDTVNATLERKRLWPNDGSELYSVASDLGRCIATLDETAVIPPAQREELCELAVATLREAVLNGFRATNELKQDNGLVVLGTRPDFQQLLRELEEITPSPGK
jgi:hypothetical protein